MLLFMSTANANREAHRLVKRLKHRGTDWPSEPARHSLSPVIVTALIKRIAAQNTRRKRWSRLAILPYLLLCLFSFIFPALALPVAFIGLFGIAYVALWCVREREKPYAIYALTQTEDMRALNPLLSATSEAFGWHPEALCALKRLLSLITEEHIGLLNPPAQEALLNLAIRPTYHQPDYDEELALLALQTCACIGNKATLTNMQKFAHQPVVLQGPWRVNAVLKQLLPDMEARLQRQAVPQTLLRASMYPSPPETLLRAAHASGIEPSKELLRPSVTDTQDARQEMEAGAPILNLEPDVALRVTTIGANFQTAGSAQANTAASQILHLSAASSGVPQLLNRLKLLKRDWPSESELHRLDPRTIEALLEFIAAQHKALFTFYGPLLLFYIVFCISQTDRAQEFMRYALLLGLLCSVNSLFEPGRQTRLATYALTQTDDLRVLPALIKATRHRWGRHSEVLRALLRLLNRIEEEHAGLLDAAMQKRLWNLAVVPLNSDSRMDMSLTLAALRALGRIGSAEILENMWQLAKQVPQNEPNRQIMEAAQELVPGMTSRLQHPQISQTILIAEDVSTSPTVMLLNSVYTKNSEPTEQLQRVSSWQEHE